jgi:hypothetical protein
MRTKLTAEEKERAKVLAASGQTPHRIGKALARSPHTVAKFLHQPEIQQQVGVQREELATMFDAITDRTLRGVTDEDIRKSSLLQKMTAAGISIDKAMLLRNQAAPTINVTLLLGIAKELRRDDDDPPALPPPES